MFNKVEIKKYEKGLICYKGEYKLLDEGIHNLPFLLRKMSWLDYLLKHL